MDQDQHSANLVSGISETDLQALRAELLQAGLDNWQAGELISSFLVARGFGVSAGEARQVATLIESQCCSLDYMRQALNSLVFVM